MRSGPTGTGEMDPAGTAFNFSRSSKVAPSRVFAARNSTAYGDAIAESPGLPTRTLSGADGAGTGRVATGAAGSSELGADRVIMNVATASISTSAASPAPAYALGDSPDGRTGTSSGGISRVGRAGFRSGGLSGEGMRLSTRNCGGGLTRAFPTTTAPSTLSIGRAHV